MSRWNASHYLKFGGERTRAAVDLAARILVEDPRSIVDLGCGPGNSTQILRTRWPKAKVRGIDSSAEMIDAANATYPEQDWLQLSIADWETDENVDVVYSNAALHWLPDHKSLVSGLFRQVSEHGALAFQIPSGNFIAVRRIFHELSRDARWADRMEGPRKTLTMESPEFYYDLLVGEASSLDIWETEYHHVMDSTDSIVDWMSSTGLRPFLNALGNDDERSQFLSDLRSRVAEAYEIRADGKVLFPFRRTFVIAYR